MNILLIAKLSDDTIKDNVLNQLIAIPIVNHIYVLRDSEISCYNPKVSFICPHTSSFRRHFIKIRLGIDLCKHNPIGCIIGVLNSPHGYIGMIIHFLTHIPYIHMTIAGSREFTYGGKLVELFNLFVFKRSRFVTVTGSQTRDYLLRHGYGDDNIKIIPNLPNPLFNNCKLNSGIRSNDIISFSRIDKNKNVSLLIRALSLIKDQCPVHAIIAGDGVERDNVISLAHQLSVESYVSFPGFISDVQSKIDLLNSSKLFVSCSKGEGFPISMLEAMSCGCVPVASNVGDTIDVIDQWHNGVVYQDTNNPNELCSIICTLLQTQNGIASMSKEASKVRQKMSSSVNSNIWEGMLKLISIENGE